MTVHQKNMNSLKRYSLEYTKKYNKFSENVLKGLDNIDEIDDKTPINEQITRLAIRFGENFVSSKKDKKRQSLHAALSMLALANNAPNESKARLLLNLARRISRS